VKKDDTSLIEEKYLLT